MSQKLYVGGLSYATNDVKLQALFATYGTVVSAVVISDRETGRSKGFGFVEMSTDAEATQAVQELNGKNVDGRNIIVNEAKERAPRRASGNSRW